MQLFLLDKETPETFEVPVLILQPVPQAALLRQVRFERTDISREPVGLSSSADPSGILVEGQLSIARHGWVPVPLLNPAEPFPEATEVAILGSIEALSMRDDRDRLLLHYAASYGLLLTCQKIITTLREVSTIPHAVIQAMRSVDRHGIVPLQLTVMENHTSTATYLVDILAAEDAAAGGETPVKTIMGDILHTALRNQNDEIVRHLIRANTDLSCRHSRGETALHVAAQLGRADYTDLIIRAMPRERAGLDVPDTSRGWTPLFVGCASGHYELSRSS